MKKWIYLLSLLFVTEAFANENVNNITFFADALWWQMQESNASNWGQILYPDRSNETITFLHVPFNYSPGLRIGVGFNGKDTPWNALLYYTGYKTQGTSQASTDTGQIHSAFSSNFYANNPQGNGVTGPYYHQASIKWDLAYNTLDFEVGRLSKFANLLDLRPFAGLKAAAINQSINSQWSNPPPVQGTLMPSFTLATEKISNDFSGIGPSTGIDSILHLYSTPTFKFNLLGKFSGSLLWSLWSFSDNFRNDTPQSIATKSDNITSAASMVRGYLGLEWSSFSKKADWNINLGYEEQVWFNQLQYYSFDMGKTNDTLYLSGFVLGVDVKF